MAKVSNQGQPEKQILDQTPYLWKKIVKKILSGRQPTSCQKNISSPPLAGSADSKHIYIH
jgi:hypothetical protein